MNNKLFEYLCNDKNFSVRTAEELRCELEAEMQKELFEKIAELSIESIAIPIT